MKITTAHATSHPVSQGEYGRLSPVLEGASAFEKTVAAIIPEWPTIDGRVRIDLVFRCAGLVLEQISLAPFYSRVGFRVLFVGYRVFAMMRGGLNPSAALRETLLRAFSRLPLPMVGALERVLRSTTFLFYFEQPEVLESMHEETITARQVAYRLKRKQELAR